MLHHATKVIYNALSTGHDGLKVFTDETDTSSFVWLQFKLESGGSYRIKFFSSDEDNDVAVRVFSLLKVTDEKKASVLLAISDLNNRFRYSKFTLDKDNDVNVEFDFPQRTTDDSLGAGSYEIIVRFNDIIDQAYPVLMRALYA